MEKLNMLLTSKQQRFMFADDARINLLFGSVRSGKTYVSLLKFAIFVAKSPRDSRFLICGVTHTSLKRNCLDLLMDLVGSSNFQYSLNRKEGRLFGRMIFIEGAGDSTSEQKIRGLTLKGAYCDEVTLYNENFFMMLLSRLSVTGAKMYATCNPDKPTHYIKERFIDNPKELNCKVWDFKLTDNTFLDQEYVDNLVKEYTGVFYDRYILGKWVKAEGLIFPMYDESYGEAPRETVYEQYCISIDYGTQNPFAAILWGKSKSVWYAIKEYYYSGREKRVQKTDDEYVEDISRWVDDFFDNDKKQLRPEQIKTIVDPSAASFIVLLRKTKGFSVAKADNAVIDGIRETARALQSGKVKISPSMINWTNEASGYVWDAKSGEDKPVKEEDHLMDSMRYFIKTMRIVHKKGEYVPLWN